MSNVGPHEDFAQVDVGGRRNDYLRSAAPRERFERCAAQELLVSMEYRHLTPKDIAPMEALLTTFGEAFNEVGTYAAKRPSTAYLRRLLGGESFIALVALKNGDVVGGIAAYELRKFEQERSEIYIYDLAVAAAHRRKGIATALIEELKAIAATRGAHVIFVQADTGIEDAAAVALYTKLGVREDVLHFDIAVAGNNGAA
jgi:aminoglycoside 3-N-acetyltransferase I